MNNVAEADSASPSVFHYSLMPFHVITSVLLFVGTEAAVERRSPTERSCLLGQGQVWIAFLPKTGRSRQDSEFSLLQTVISG